MLADTTSWKSCVSSSVFTDRNVCSTNEDGWLRFLAESANTRRDLDLLTRHQVVRTLAQNHSVAVKNHVHFTYFVVAELYNAVFRSLYVILEFAEDRQSSNGRDHVEECTFPCLCCAIPALRSFQVDRQCCFEGRIDSRIDSEKVVFQVCKLFFQ